MSYGLKYYAEIQNYNRQLARVEIYQRDLPSGTSVLQIGDVCGLALEVQGGMDDIFAPIVKTQARLSMISSDDKPTADGIKYGGWGEFFTPDDTLYKMVIKTKATPETSSWTTRWSGYITPDSWSEGLDYRSPVTITARDNIGHLQDFEFDMPGDDFGLVTIKDLIEGAMSKISLAMTFAWTAADAAITGPVYLTSAHVVATNFYGKDWYSVLEGLLESIGYTIRFTDNNTITAAPIRHLPLLGYAGEANVSSPTELDFFGGTGEQVPAVKKITDEHDYDFSGEIFLPIMGEITYGTTQTYRAKMAKNPDPNHGTVDIPEADGYYNKVTANGGTVWNTGSDMVKVADYITPPIYLEEGWNNYAFLAANGTDASIRKQSLSFFCGSTDITLKAVFAKKPVAIFQDTLSQVLRMGYIDASLYKIVYGVRYQKGNNTRYWNGHEWATSSNLITIEEEYDSVEGYHTDFEVHLQPCDDLGADGTLTVFFEGIWYRHWSRSIGYTHGFYARLASFSVALNRNNLSKSTVKTVNEDKYNILLNRTPMFSPLSTDAPYVVPENYGTALYYYPSAGMPSAFPFMLNWDTVSSQVTKPLPVLIHQQILCYRGANLWQLNGDCAPKQDGPFYFNQRLDYKGRTYILQSGTLDFFSGRVESAVLREYLDYDDIWDDSQPVDPGDPGSWENISSYPGSGSPSSYSPAGSSIAPSVGKNYFEEDGNGNVKLKEDYAGIISPFAASTEYIVGAVSSQFGSSYHGLLLEAFEAGTPIYLRTNSYQRMKIDHTGKIYIGYTNAAAACYLEWDETNNAWHLHGNFYTDGFNSAGGPGGGSGSGIDLDRVWQSLTNNTDKPNVKINAAHIPVATNAAIGGVMVDGITITITDGVISAVGGGGGGSVNAIKVGSTSYLPDASGIVSLPAYPTASFGTAGDDYIPITLGSTTKNVLTAHQSLYGYATENWVNQQGFLGAVPQATNDVIGGFKTGYTESNNNYAVKLDSNYRAYVTVPSSGYTLPAASSSSLGGIKIGFSESGNDYAVKLDSNNKAYVTVQTGSYTLPLAANGTRGGIQIGFSESNSGSDTSRNYAVKLSSEKAYVNVPWANTTYKLTVNGTVKGDSSSGTDLGTIYAPATAGTQGYGLLANADGIPTWTDLSGKFLSTLGGNVTGNVTIGTVLTDADLKIIGKLRIGGTTLANSTYLEWDETNNAWHLKGNFYTDGFNAAGGLGGGSASYVTLADAQTITGAKTFSVATTFSTSITSGDIFVGQNGSGSSAVQEIKTTSDRLYIQRSVSQDLVLCAGNNSHVVVGPYPGGSALTNYKLYVDGKARATAWETSSDARLKENVLEINTKYALSKLLALRPVTWTWNSISPNKGRTSCGFIAQEVEGVLPQMVSGTDLKNIDYTMLHAFEVAGLQDHEKRIRELEKRMNNGTR